jgi:hypothetical protein
MRLYPLLAALSLVRRYASLAYDAFVDTPRIFPLNVFARSRFCTVLIVVFMIGVLKKDTATNTEADLKKLLQFKLCK